MSKHSNKQHHKQHHSQHHKQQHNQQHKHQRKHIFFVFVVYFALVFLILALTLEGGEALALGLGPYLGYEYGDITLKPEDFHGKDKDFSANHFVFGFLLDTCTARDKLFNYRFNMGVDIVNATPDQPIYGYRDAETGYGVDMKHTFGFGIVRTSAVRFWMGPAIKYYINAYLDTPEDDIVSFGAGGGLELGVNIHFGGGFSLGISGGYLTHYVFADLGDDDSHNGHENMFFMQIAPIFAWQLALIR